MAWTTPRTWVAGEIVTAALLNTHIRDNLSDLFDRAASGLASAASAATTVLTNTSYAQLLTLSVSITTVGNPVILLFLADASETGGAIVDIRWQRSGGTNPSVLNWPYKNAAGNAMQAQILNIDQPAAGANSWTIESRMTGGTNYTIHRPVLVAWELY